MGDRATTLLDACMALPSTRAPGRRGHIAAGHHDEDVVTLGVRASARLLSRTRVRPSALVLATVSSPFAEGGVAQVLAEALDLQGELLVVEQSGTVVAGATALTVAAGLAAPGTDPVLVVAADTRRDARGRALGDAAVAALLTQDTHPDEHVARVTDLGSRAELFRDRWRRDGEARLVDADRSLRRWSPAANAARSTGDDEDVVLVGPDGPRLDRVGVLGTPGFLVHGLVAADERPAATTVGASASGVTQVMRFEPGPRLPEVAASMRREAAGGIDRPWPSTDGAVAGFDPYASQPRSWRDRAQDLRLVGQRDPSSGEVLFPALPASASSGLEPVPLARTGTVHTFTRDHVYPHGGPISMAVVALDGGGRFYGQVTDGDEVAVGDRVHLELRRLHDGGGLPHYYWKVALDEPTRQPVASTREA